MNQLTRYDIACTALAEAKSVDEVKEIRNKSDAIRAYARQTKNRTLELDAAEIRIRAERRLGEMLVEQKKNGGLNTGMIYRGTTQEPRDTTPTLAEVGIDKKLSSRAQKLAAVPEDNFEVMVGEWRDKVTHENERITVNLLRAGEKAQRDAKFTEQKMVWPSGRYPVIYADPPWRYENPPMGGANRSIENHYPTMTLAEICDLPVAELATENSMLFLWATAPKLAECMEVIEAWGFMYRTGMVWVKDKIGMGYYARGKHEHLLIARKGTPGTPDPGNRPASVLNAPRTKHSEKPHEFYQLIESMYPGIPKVELFSRSPQPGWDVWGFEAA